MKSIYFTLLTLFTAIAAHAQTIKITVTENGEPMSYHNITVSQNGSEIGYGETDSRGVARISVNNLYGQAIDVAGKYQNGGTKKEWSIKGKLKLDGNNSVHIKLEDMGPKSSDLRMGGISNDLRMGGKSEDSPSGPAKSISKSEFQTSLKEIDNMMSSFDKADKAKSLARNYKLSSAQVKDLVSKLNSSFAQKDVAIMAYPNCTDQKNYKMVTELFQSSIMKRDVENATINK
jgi:hypothetical protein